MLSCKMITTREIILLSLFALLILPLLLLSYSPFTIVQNIIANYNSATACSSSSSLINLQLDQESIAIANHHHQQQHQQQNQQNDQINQVSFDQSTNPKYRTSLRIVRSNIDPRGSQVETNASNQNVSNNINDGNPNIELDDTSSCIPNCSQGIGVKRKFKAYGSGAYLFVQMSSYRGGPREFFINGLGSKPVHVFSDASFQCEWLPSNISKPLVKGQAIKMIPDSWNFGRVYTAVIVQCKFDEDVIDGGDLILYASPTSSFNDSSIGVERIVVLSENQGDYNATKFEPPYQYEYMYCGSPLFGHLNPHRIREWLAYHTKFFGPKSHFMFYDAGGIHPSVQEVLQPWINAGRVTVHNIRAQEEFDGYYHNQFMIVNDCLHKTRFMANWTFYFDVDEYLYLPPNSSLESLLEEHSQFTQLFFEQRPMSSHLCLNNPKANYTKMWGFEKLVFLSTKKTRRDRKYVIQPRNVFATGIHLSQHFKGHSIQIRGDKVRYYHYHGTISLREEACQNFLNATKDKSYTYWFDKEPFTLDFSMQQLASSIKHFEVEQIGEQSFIS